MISKDKSIFSDGESFRGYRIEKLLGRGGLGLVYLVRHEMLDVLYALKVLYPAVAVDNPIYIKRFLREARIATRIRHPNLVSVHDCGFDSEKGVYYLVMDYVSGGNLRDAIALSGRMDCAEAVKIVMQVARALDAAQCYGVVHRDIKPENIMLQPDGSVKLVDLGIAKAEGIKDSLHTTMESLFGTPAYISPEQAISATDVDVRADIYSLGIVFFEMVSGRCPYCGENAPAVLMQVLSDDPAPDVRDFASDVPAPIAVLIRRMCVKEKERRITSTSMLIAELAKLGYAGCELATVAEYSPAIECDKKEAFLLGVDLCNLPKEVNNTLSFETQDVEIQRFVTRLKRRRFMKKHIWAVISVAFILLVLVVLIW
jgi:serine/threonine-protein kinase